MEPLTNPEPGILEYGKTALRGWKPLVAFTIAGALGGIIASRWAQPTYRTDALLQIDTQAKQLAGSLGQMADLFQTDSKAETEIELVQSREVLGAVVDSLGLDNMAAPQGFARRLMGKLGRMDLNELWVPVALPLNKNPKPWTLVVLDSAHVALRDPSGQIRVQGAIGTRVIQVVGKDTLGFNVRNLRSEPGETFSAYKFPKALAIAGLNGSLLVAEKGRRTGILQLTFTARYPDKARDVLNAIAKSYVRQNVETRSSEARKTLEFLQGQLPLVKEHLDSVENILKNYKFQRGTVDLVSEAQIVLRENQDLQQQIVGLEQRRQDLLRLYKEDHPAVVSLDAQKQQLQRLVENTNRQTKAMPLTQQEMIRLTRDVEVNTALYTALKNNVQQLQIVQGGEVGSARVVDYATLIPVPVGPKKRVLQLAGLLLGIALGTGWVFGLAWLKQTTQDINALETLTGLSVLAQIPRSRTETQGFRQARGLKPILALTSPNDLAVEGVRSLRTSLDLATIGQARRIVSVTGLAAGEGKSFVSINLAVLLAQLGKKVVLMDADLRLGRLHDHFGIGREAGLSEFLQGSLGVDAILKKTEVAGLVFIPAGIPVPNASELVGSSIFGELIAKLSVRADYVIIDTPPILAVTDAVLAMRHSNQSLFVLEPDAHTNSEIQDAVRRARLAESSLLGLVLNKTPAPTDADSPYGIYGNVITQGRA